MRESLQTICRRFLANRQLIRQVMKAESGYIYPVCANVFCAAGRDASAEQLLACKKLLKEKTGVFSNFRGNLRAPVVCMLAAGTHPEVRMDRALENYKMLRGRFRASQYLALAAFLLTDLGAAGSHPEAIDRSRVIYNLMKARHPLLTASEDSVFAVFLAFSEKSDDELIEDMEECFGRLKKAFPTSNCLQSVSHVLCMGPGRPEEKVARLTLLYNAIGRKGGKYGKYYELSTLAALSLLRGEIEAVAADVMEVDSFLAGQKGYGGLGLDRKTRLMHAVMLVTDDLMAQQQPAVCFSTVEQQTVSAALGSAPLTSTLALVVAQQAAMCAVMASTAATSAAASSH